MALSQNLRPPLYKNLSSAWIDIIYNIDKFGAMLTSEYKKGLERKKTKALLGMLVELESIGNYHTDDPFCTPERVAEYEKQFYRNYKHGFEYTYMDRFTKWGEGKDKEPLDQIEKIISELQKSEKHPDGRKNTKRLQISTWDPRIDLFKEEDQPCLQRIWIYPYSVGDADIHIHYRSWDAWNAFESNIIAITNMVKREILEPSDLEQRRVRLFADNIHIYEEYWDDAKKILRKNGLNS